MGAPLLTRIGLGAATGGLSEIGYGGKAALDALKPKTPNSPRELAARAEEKRPQVLQSAKSRAERLSAARGRRSFRIQLASPDPKMARGGLAIG